MNGLHKLFVRFRLLERIFRLSPRCAAKEPNGNIVFSMHGGLYSLDLKKKALSLQHKFITGMNNPLMISMVEGIEGFEDGLYYGEYVPKQTNREVSIWKKTHGEWEVCFRFQPNEITHIHGIIPDPYHKGLLILTGDLDSESAIWLAEKNFNHVMKIKGGKQRYRACVAVPTEKGIFYATDDPFEQNKIRLLIRQGNSWEEQEISDLPGTVLYADYNEQRILFSCTVEPDSTKSGIRYLLTCSLASGIQDNFVRVFRFDLKTFLLEEQLRVPKDMLPGGLAQFGSAMFAAKDKGIDRTVVYFTSVQRWDNAYTVLEEK